MNRALILDFDGPVANLYAGLSAGDIAGYLIEALGENLTGDWDERTRQDPGAILKEVYWLEGPSKRFEVLTEALEILEVKASQMAQPTPGAHKLLTMLDELGYSWGIATNSSEGAVYSYMGAQGLHGFRDPIVEGRQRWRPDTMKPNPDSVLRVLERFERRVDKTYFVGDSATDVEAALAANVTPIGLADTEERRKELEAAGALVVFETMDAVAEFFFEEQPF